MQFIFRIPSRFMTVFFGFDPCVTIYYDILFRKSELKRLTNRLAFLADQIKSSSLDDVKDVPFSFL